MTFFKLSYFFGTGLEYNLSNATVMETTKKTVKEEEKEWENPVEPTKTTDPRDEEQILRQYNEAKRRKNNLTENQEAEKKDLEKKIKSAKK